MMEFIKTLQTPIKFMALTLTFDYVQVKEYSQYHMQEGNDTEPSYKIRYIECKQNDHQGEKVNMVCLNKGCAQNMLICSLCHIEKHSGHEVEPLKFYLQSLYRMNKKQRQETNEKLEQLQRVKNIFLLKIKQSVEQIAQHIMSLEQHVIQKIDIIRHNILENDAKKNNFDKFYNTLVREGYGDPQFEIQNYIPTVDITLKEPKDELQQFTRSVTDQIDKLQKALLQESKEDKYPKDIKLEMDGKLFLKPPNIKESDKVYIQTDKGKTSSIVMLSHPIKSMQTKAKIKLLKLGKNPDSRIVVGVIDKSIVQQNNFVFVNEKGQWIDNFGKTNAINFNHITKMVEGDQIEITFRKMHCKMECKKNICDMLLASKDHHFFFAIFGDTEVEVQYPLNK